jgi:hypothetical protein
VWEQLFKVAGLTFVGKWETLGAEDLNGRNIRNAVRVLRMLTSDKEITMAHVHRALKYIAR